MKLPIALLILSITAQSEDYGVKQDSLPNYQERAIQVLTNACRMAPEEFRNRYIGDTLNILLPEKYPAVDPLFWNNNLNVAAHYYTNVMSDSNKLSHTLDGTFSNRLKRFYTGVNIGENIASGYRTPLDVIIGWICESSNPVNAVPDGQNDGHRANIMSSKYKEIGCGYHSDTTVSGRRTSTSHWWCQDFGSNTTQYSYHPIPAGSHFFIESNKTTFMANCFDKQNRIMSVTLTIDNTNQEMTLLMGNKNRGTFATTLPKASDYRQYFFTVKLSDGSTFRYPEKGVLITYGEGNCTDDFSWNETKISISVRQKKIKRIHSVFHSSSVSISSASWLPDETVIYDGFGRMLSKIYWKSTPVSTQSISGISNGLFILKHQFSDESLEVEKLHKIF